MDNYIKNAQKLLEAKLLLDTFDIPKRPITLSSHQYKKKFGSNQGYSDYKKSIKVQRREWDELHKALYNNNKVKSKYLLQVELSDEALDQAQLLSQQSGCSIPEILSQSNFDHPYTF